MGESAHLWEKKNLVVADKIYFKLETDNIEAPQENREGLHTSRGQKLSLVKKIATRGWFFGNFFMHYLGGGMQ